MAPTFCCGRRITRCGGACTLNPSSRFDIVSAMPFSVFPSVRPTTAAPQSPRDERWRHIRANAMKPVCLVIGAGAGIGGHTGKRFAQEGYHAVLCRRSDQDGLEQMVEVIESEGGSASGFLLDATEADGIEERVAAVEADIGPIEVAVYNLGRPNW